jgi:hypothetical protein
MNAYLPTQWQRHDIPSWFTGPLSAFENLYSQRRILYSNPKTKKYHGNPFAILGTFLSIGIPTLAMTASETRNFDSSPLQSVVPWLFMFIFVSGMIWLATYFEKQHEEPDLETEIAAKISNFCHYGWIDGAALANQAESAEQDIIQSLLYKEVRQAYQAFCSRTQARHQ